MTSIRRNARSNGMNVSILGDHQPQDAPFIRGLLNISTPGRSDSASVIDYAPGKLEQVRSIRTPENEIVDIVSSNTERVPSGSHSAFASTLSWEPSLKLLSSEQNVPTLPDELPAGDFDNLRNPEFLQSTRGSRFAHCRNFSFIPGDDSLA